MADEIPEYIIESSV